MEPMVIFALWCVVYCGYKTVRDILADLQEERTREHYFGGNSVRLFALTLTAGAVMSPTARQNSVRLAWKAGRKGHRGVLSHIGT